MLVICHSFSKRRQGAVGANYQLLNDYLVVETSTANYPAVLNQVSVKTSLQANSLFLRQLVCCPTPSTALGEKPASYQWSKQRCKVQSLPNVQAEYPRERNSEMFTSIGRRCRAWLIGVVVSWNLCDDGLLGHDGWMASFNQQTSRATIVEASLTTALQIKVRSCGQLSLALQARETGWSWYGYWGTQQLLALRWRLSNTQQPIRADTLHRRQSARSIVSMLLWCLFKHSFPSC